MIINNKVIKNICMMLILSSNAGFLHAASVDDMTPLRQRVGVSHATDFTPGKKISQKQAEVLTVEKFEEVFGELPKALETVNLAQFQNTSEVFDNPLRRIAIRTITAFVKKQFIADPTNTNISVFYASIEEIKSSIDQLHPERLWERTEDYFRGRFPYSTVARQHKQSGDQLGLTAVVNHGSARSVKYFVKTHAGGFRSGSGSAAANLVQPEELMSYALLEELGIGCEAHFFGRDARNFYVATKDAGHDCPFNVFQRPIGSHSSGVKPDEEYAKTLWGNLGDLITDSPDKNQQPDRSELIEGEIQRNPVASNFARQISKLDVVSRLMRLTDLLSNSENFGFTDKELGKMLTVIDFRIADNAFQHNFDSRDFGGFTVGNGFFRYDTADKIVAYMLRERALEYRVRTAFEIMVTELETMPFAIKRAYDRVQSLPKDLLSDDITPDNSEKFLRTLSDYKDALLHNYGFFKRNLEEWKPGPKE